MLNLIPWSETDKVIAKEMQSFTRTTWLLNHGLQIQPPVHYLLCQCSTRFYIVHIGKISAYTTLTFNTFFSYSWMSKRSLKIPCPIVKVLRRAYASSRMRETHSLVTIVTDSCITRKEKLLSASKIYSITIADGGHNRTLGWLNKRNTESDIDTAI